MKKHFLIIILMITFLFSPIIVKADFGDLRYEITDVNILGSKITFKGWAFIHRTHNYITVENYDGGIIKSGGGQKVIMQAYSGDRLIATESNDLLESDAEEKANYNFYCELFFKGVNSCNKNSYASESLNNCKNNSNGTAIDDSQCYYEDMYFEITFDFLELGISDLSSIKFKIAASNNDYESKIGCSGDMDCYTEFEDVSIAYASVSKFSNEFIEIDKESLSTSVDYIASTGLLLSPTNVSQYFRYNGTCTYGSWNNSGACGGKISYYIDLNFGGNFKNGRSNNDSSGMCYSWLGNGCRGTHYYALKVKKNYEATGYVCYFACPYSGSGTDYYTAIARGSHVKTTGTFEIKVKNDKKCEVTNPLPNRLECNNSSTLSSTCNELNVHTSEGSSIVKIEQVGTVSSVLTPSETYAGGGVKFGVMYYNTIKWTYVNGKPNDTLHAAVVVEMNKKIKDYNSYIAGIDISELKLGGKSFSGLVKQCSTSNVNKDYYNKELTVSCVFTFSQSVLNIDGSINYNFDSSSLNINNKYYTPIDYSGVYKIEANIVGMDRITSSSALTDSKQNGKTWTGNWSDSFENCQVNLYSLFYKDGSYNFVYRPIDIYNPFPGRNAGFNWFEWYNISRNKDRLEKSYSNIQYVSTLDNNVISDIKNYNKDNTYLNWDNIKWDRVDGTYYSDFITENDYIDRVGGN